MALIMYGVWANDWVFRANKKAVYPSIYRNFPYFRIFLAELFVFLGGILLIIQGSFNLIIYIGGNQKECKCRGDFEGFPCYLCIVCVWCHDLRHSQKFRETPPENPCNPRSSPHIRTRRSWYGQRKPSFLGVRETQGRSGWDWNDTNRWWWFKKSRGENPPFGCIKPPKLPYQLAQGFFHQESTVWHQDCTFWWCRETSDFGISDFKLVKSYQIFI